MTKYIEKEREKYWPVSSELLAQYDDGSHTEKDEYGLYWYHNGLWHRDGDKPAVIKPDGTLSWWQNGQRHRDEDKPAVIGSNGELGWYQNGRWHRDGDKPAFFGTNGTLVWYQNGQRHRSRGPAVIYLNGMPEWWINHKNITDEVNEWLNREPWCGTPEQIVEFQLRFG